LNIYAAVPYLYPDQHNIL